jgi:hypothetical protein
MRKMAHLQTIAIPEIPEKKIPNRIMLSTSPNIYNNAKGKFSMCSLINFQDILLFNIPVKHAL